MIALLLLALAAPGPAWACGPQVHLTGSDAPLLDEVASALRARGIRAWTNDEAADSEWGCSDLAVSMEVRGAQIVLATTDPQGRAQVRSVHAPATAVALVESWLITEPTTELIGAPATWSLAVRAEGAGGNDRSWAVGPGVTLARRFGFVFHAEVTARAVGLSQPNPVVTGATSVIERLPRAGFELVAGAALRWDVGALSLWAGASGGGRVLTGAQERNAALIEPMLAFSVPVTHDLELELRTTAQFLTVEQVSSRDVASWWVVRGGLGLRWGL